MQRQYLLTACQPTVMMIGTRPCHRRSREVLITPGGTAKHNGKYTGSIIKGKERFRKIHTSTVYERERSRTWAYSLVGGGV
jgi:hypothetical protein